MEISGLPTSATCHRMMIIPKYPTFEHLKEKFDTAISFAKIGFTD